MNTRLLLAACAATVSLAACGGGEDPAPASGAGSQEAANRKAMVDFARCMRKNGVDMPDPQFGEGGRVAVEQSRTDPETARTAERACAKYRDAVKPPKLSDEQEEEFKRQALANARCMRKNGIDMPDPQFSEDGGAIMRMRGRIDPESDEFKRAQRPAATRCPARPR